MTKVNEKTLLWVDETKVKDAERQVRDAVKNLNEFVKMTETLLGENLTPENKNRLMVEGWAFVDEVLKSRYPFPDANDKFNYDALGIDPTKVITFNARHRGNWIYANYDLTGDGVFVAGEHQPLIKKHHYYPDTDKKRQALRLAQELKERFQELKKYGIIEHRDLTVNLREATNGLLKADEGKNHGDILINKEKIAKLR